MEAKLELRIGTGEERWEIIRGDDEAVISGGATFYDAVSTAKDEGIFTLEFDGQVMDLMADGTWSLRE